MKFLDQCIDACQQGSLQKVIASRPIHLLGELNAESLFNLLLEMYPDSFTYWLDTGDRQYLGSTPERLLTVEANSCKSVALAGTMKVAEGQNLEKWGEKERVEQLYVEDFIAKVFNGYCSEVERTATTVLNNGPVCHLYSEVKGEISNANELPNLLQELHPTPAVCGLPKEKSREFIRENESYARRYYCGYIGIKEKHQSRYYVNLRCLEVNKDETTIFVGGGITKDSIASNELEETRLKSRVMLNAIEQIHELIE